jgi:hypothetical protein
VSRRQRWACPAALPLAALAACSSSTATSQPGGYHAGPASSSSTSTDASTGTSAPTPTSSADQITLAQVGADLAALGYERGAVTQAIPDACSTSGATFTARTHGLIAGKPVAVWVVLSPDAARTPGAHTVSPQTTAAPTPAALTAVHLGGVDEGGRTSDDAVSTAGMLSVDPGGTSGRFDVQLTTVATRTAAGTLSGPWSCR